MTASITHWSHENQERAKAMLDLYPEKRSAVMPLLYLASLEHEYVSEDAMREVAELVGITPAQVEFVTNLPRATYCVVFASDPEGGRWQLATTTHAYKAPIHFNTWPEPEIPVLSSR